MNPFIINSLEGMITIKKAWEALYAQSPHATCFQSFHSNFSWIAKHHETFTPMVLCYGSKKKIETLLPTCLDLRKKRLVFMQQGAVDILDLLYSPKCDLYANLSKMRKHLEHEYPSPSIQLTNIRKESPLVEMLAAIYQKKPFFICQHDIYSRLDAKQLHSERYLSHIPSKSYIRLKKIDTSLLTNGKIVSSPNPFPEQSIKNLLYAMKKAGIRDLKVYEELLPMMRDFYQEGCLFFMIQSMGDRTISLTALIRLTSTEIMGWIDLYAPDIRRGNLKNYLHILDYCKKNGLSFNLGTGLYEYKTKNFQPEVHALFSFNHDPRPFRFAWLFGKKLLIKTFKRI